MRNDDSLLFHYLSIASVDQHNERSIPSILDHGVVTVSTTIYRNYHTDPMLIQAVFVYKLVILNIESSDITVICDQ